MSDDEVKIKLGRPTAFKPEFIEQAEKLCRLGATDNEIADFFGITTRTLYRWRLDNEVFCQSLKIGKEISDARVERSLYERANGYTYIAQEAVKLRNSDGSESLEIVEVEKHFPPDTTSMIFWLKNRKRLEWRDKPESEEKPDNGITDDDTVVLRPDEPIPEKPVL